MKTKLTIFIFLPFFVLTSCSNKEVVTFHYKDYVYETLYDDSYFLLDNSIYHQEIALASHASALTTIKDGDDYENRPAYLIDLWKKEGFKDFFINEGFIKKPTDTSIGYAIANKRVDLNNDPFNLITITVRSGHYEAEMANNFKIGYEGNAEGFENASNEIKEGIYQYLLDNHITGHTKFWLNGFSRGAITANMAAGKMIDDMENNTFISSVISSKEDIYAYCFEPPNGVLIDEDIAKSDLYKGIHNFLNMNDLVPMVAPHGYGFTHYGQDYYYPDRLTDIYFDHSERKKIVTNYHFTKGAENYQTYCVDDWKFFDAGQELTSENNLARESIHPSMGRMFAALINDGIVTTLNRDYYAQLVEPGIIEFLKVLYGYNNDISDKPFNLNSIADIIYSYSFAKSIINELLQKNASGFVFDMEILLYQILGLNENNREAIGRLMSYMLPLLAVLGIVLSNRPDLVLQLFNKDNMRAILIGHNSDLGYSFTKSMDSRFYGEDACKLNDGTYKILKINKPTSFKIYENNLKKDIFIYSNNKMESDTLSAEKLADGSINIFLPNNGSYTYEGNVESLSLYGATYYGDKTLIKDNLPHSGNI